MANLKRTYIELVKNPEEVIKGGEPELEKVWTPPFLPWRTTRLALSVLTEDKDTSEIEMIDKMEDFVVNEVFKGVITLEDLHDRLHAPEGIVTLQDVIKFVAEGAQSEEVKKFMAKKN